jgi:hypothetical protein
MSVLRKIQFADARMIGEADWAIIGAGAAECQKSVGVVDAARTPACFIGAR